jgi:undecaprenyl-phosphate 4-deoxy-4-formamido-L-arabinose transferase
MKLSIVIPCYNSEKFLNQTINGVIKEMENTRQGEYEIILINDCSPDNTFGVIRKLSEENSHIIGIDLARNFGQHSALMAGFQYVSGDVIVCMDDDGQTPPGEIHKLVGAISADTDVVYAKYRVKKHSWYRNIGSKLNSKMTEVMLGKPHDLYLSSFFAAKRYIIDEIKKYEHSFPYVIGLVLRTTKNIKNVDVEHKNREIGESGYSLSKLFGLWLNGFTAFSIMPLRIADVVGGICAVAGFIYLVFVIVRRLVLGDRGYAGWSSLISINLIVGGIMLCALGIIGEYIGRMYLCMNRTPQYVIKETVGNSDSLNKF